LDFVPDKPANEPVARFRDKELHSRLDEWLDELPAKQKEVLIRRFGLQGFESDTLENVGAEIGLTRERVRQIQIEALQQLKLIIGREGIAKDILGEFALT
jgi:RNA polymerase nonessential primary-like sigma factor